MAKKHQQREHVSVRKKREEELKLAKRRAFYQKHKKQLIAAAIALVAAVVVICLALDYFVCPGGSMRMFLGNLIGAEEHQIIRNLGSKKAPLYFNFGTYEAPAGYTLDAQYTLNTNSDNKEQNFYYNADDETNPIATVYVSGVGSRKGAEMLNTLSGNGMYTFTGEKHLDVALGGHKVNYIYTQMNPSSEDTTVFAASLVAYVDTIKDSTILFHCSSGSGPLETLPTEETMVALVEDIVKGLTLPPL